MIGNLKVLELASVLAGPSVGQFFAELGAEVIKVENPLTGGDVTRSWKLADEQTDDRSAYFCSVNWGKKSISLDLTSHSGLSVVQKLSQQSDIIIASYKAGDAERLGVSYKQIKTHNPGIIYGQITGYGSDNDRVGYDAVLQAESGFMDLNGERNGLPTKMPVALIDVLAAHQLKEGLLLALLQRERTGLGDYVEVSLIEAAVSSLVNQASNWLVANQLPVRQGSLHPNIAPYGESFETADGKIILLAIGTDKQFFDLCDLLDVSMEHRNQFSDNQKRVRGRVELARTLAIKISKKHSNTFLENLHHKKIPAGIIQNVKEALALPAVRDIYLSAPPLKGLKNFVAKSSFIKSQNPDSILPPPHFGEHSEEILSTLQQ